MSLPHFKADDFRLLFLDIDDVINSVKTCIVHGGYPFPATVKRGGKWQLDDPPVDNVEAFDHVNIKLLDRLCHKTNTHIVLSSTWRIGLTVSQVRGMLGYIGFTPELVIGRTRHDMPGWCRGQEIEDFLLELEKNSDKLLWDGLLTYDAGGGPLIPRSYVIVDDSDDMLESQKPNFVHVAENEGLSLANVVEAGKILTHGDFSASTL